VPSPAKDGKNDGDEKLSAFLDRVAKQVHADPLARGDGRMSRGAAASTSASPYRGAGLHLDMDMSSPPSEEAGLCVSEAIAALDAHVPYASFPIHHVMYVTNTNIIVLRSNCGCL
jgi:hypothetical protein